MFFLKTSLTSRRDRFRATEFPVFRVAVMPTLALFSELGRTKAVKYSARNLCPCSYTRRNIGRLRIRSCFFNVSSRVSGGETMTDRETWGTNRRCHRIHLRLSIRRPDDVTVTSRAHPPPSDLLRLVVRWGQLFATLGATPLKHELTALSPHANAEPVRFGPAAIIWLKGPFHACSTLKSVKKCKLLVYLTVGGLSRRGRQDWATEADVP